MPPGCAAHGAGFALKPTGDSIIMPKWLTGGEALEHDRTAAGLVSGSYKAASLIAAPSRGLG